MMEQAVYQESSSQHEEPYTVPRQTPWLRHEGENSK